MAFEIEALFRRTDRRRGETFVVICHPEPFFYSTARMENQSDCLLVGEIEEVQ